MAKLFMNQVHKFAWLMVGQAGDRKGWYWVTLVTEQTGNGWSWWRDRHLTSETGDYGPSLWLGRPVKGQDIHESDWWLLLLVNELIWLWVSLVIGQGDIGVLDVDAGDGYRKWSGWWWMSWWLTRGSDGWAVDKITKGDRTALGFH